MQKDSKNMQHPNDVKHKNKKRGKRRIFDRIIIIFLTLTLIVGTTIFFFLFKMIGAVNTENVSSKINASSNSTVLDTNNKKYADLGVESRENIKYAQIPQATIDAFLAIEDSRFFSHNGFDLPRFISSAINNLRSGDFAQGGSTLTMQTIDNYYTKEQEDADLKKGITYSKFQKIEMKIQEIYRSLRLEGEKNKEDIITAYFNKINFGNHARGIQRGAQYYFGKNVNQLNLSESAFLAGVVNAPNLYNPYNGVVSIKDANGNIREINYYELATKRRDDVLYQMLNHGYITKTEHDLAKATKLAFQVAGYDEVNSDPYRAYIDKVRDEVFALTGDDPTVTQMTIYTALDTNAQKVANELCNGEDIQIPDNKYYQYGFAAMNVTNGEVVAIGPGLKEDTSTGNYQNRAYNSHQTGSAIKPILDYALTFDELGWSTAHTIVDKKMSITGGRTYLQNADRKYYGPVTLEFALAHSLNTPAVQALQALIDKIGVSNVVDYMHKAGFSSIEADKFSLGYGIGGSEMVASPIQMAAAYSALANGGNYIEPHTIRKIVYGDGSKTIDLTKDKESIMSAQAAYMTSDLLDKTVNGSESQLLIQKQRGDGYTVYGKTGTSDWGDSGLQYGIPEGAMKDEWMVGYTNEYVVATWSGFDSAVDGGNTYIDDNILFMNNPGTINKRMLEALKKNPERLKRPNGITDVTIQKNVIPYKYAVNGASNAVSGMIKSSFANKIENTSITPPSNLTSFTVFQISPNSSDLTFTFTTYPGGNDQMINTYGPIVYRVTIKVDGTIVQNLTFDGPNGSDSGSIPEGKTGQVCGFYQYQKVDGADGMSNQVCQDITVGSAQNTVPDVNKDDLNAQIAAAQKLKASDYTIESYQNLQDVLVDASIVAYSSNVTQEEVDISLQNLINAMNALIRK